MKNYLYIALVVSIIINLILGYILLNQKDSSPKIATNTSEKNLPFLSPRVFIEKPNDIIINFNPLRQALRTYIEKSGQKIQLYFEYLPSGSSIGVNDQEPFTAASLFKVPVAMAALREIEDGKISEDQVLTVEKKHLDERFGDLWKKGAGTKFSVKETLEISLIKSDNTANNLLKSAIPDEYLSDVFNTLDFPHYEKGEDETLVTVKNYSSILKNLYLSSYLSENQSNYVLETLTKTPFNNRLEAGLPEKTVFSHKIGEYESIDKDNFVYSDCGIVYVPKRPYVICVAIEGESEDMAKTLMKVLSQTIHSYVTDVETK